MSGSGVFTGTQWSCWSVGGLMWSRESEMENNIQALQKASLYVFGEKSQVKNIKIDPHIKVDFIPVDYPGKTEKCYS